MQNTYDVDYEGEVPIILKTTPFDRGT